MTRNKARLVVQGYSQIEEIDLGETFSPVAHLESIQLCCLVLHALGELSFIIWMLKAYF